MKLPEEIYKLYSLVERARSLVPLSLRPKNSYYSSLWQVRLKPNNLIMRTKSDQTKPRLFK